MSHLVLLTNAWGPKYGGINSFNTDLVKALGVLLAPRVQVTCVVLEATPEEIADAAQHQVALIPITKSANHDFFEVARANDVVEALRKAERDPDVTFWIGHDVITGDIANALPQAAGRGASAVIHHMNYEAYASYKHGVGVKAQEKARHQRRIFSGANKIFAVGPLLQRSLAQMLGVERERVTMLVPGLAEIEAAPRPPGFAAITFGRLDPENDRIKQGRLAVAGFAASCREAHANTLLPEALRANPVLKVIGIDKPGGDEEQTLRALARKTAERVVALIPLPYDEDRSRVFDELRRSSAAMMLSWHEGFGLTGWEAVAAEVPLIISRNSGLYELVAATLEAPGLACMKVVNVRGWGGDAPVAPSAGDDDTDENFHPDDEKDVSRALLTIASEGDSAKRNAKRLRTFLLQELDCTWAGTARVLTRALGIPLLDRAPAPTEPPAGAAESSAPVADEKTAPGQSELLELSKPRWKTGDAESLLLRPEEAAVPFHALRRRLLDEVIGWVTTVDALPIKLQLRVGAGGAGKTRLLFKACQELADAGWVTGFLKRRDGANLRRSLLSLLKANPKTVIVVDYAEARRDEIAVLIEVAEDIQRQASAHQVRIVLLAREADDWWQRFPVEHARLERFLTGRAVSGPYRMPPVSLEQNERGTAFLEALTAFAVLIDKSATGLPVPDLSADHFSEVLFIHLSALATLFGERPGTATSLLEATLRHERRYWHETAATKLDDTGRAALDQAMALLTLADGAKTAANARRLIETSPRARVIDAKSRDHVFQILRGLYPLAGGIDALRPDILGERLVAQELAKDDELLDVVLGKNAEEGTSRNALTVLARLARQSPGDSVWLKRGLERNLIHRAQLMAQVAVQVGDPAGRLLAEVLEAAPDRDQMAAMFRLRPGLPDDTIALREVAVTVERLHVKHLESKGRPSGFRDKQELAVAYQNLGRRLRGVGNVEEALTTTLKAGPTFNDLSRAEKRTELSQNLATYEDSVALYLKHLGRYEESLTHAEIAVQIRRQLVTKGTSPSLRDDLTITLNNAANLFDQIGRLEVALNYSNEALMIGRALAAKDAGKYRSSLAMLLTTHANRLTSLGRYADALPLTEEALVIQREFSKAQPDAAAEALALLLHNVAGLLLMVGRRAEALVSGQQALFSRRHLASVRSDVFMPDLAATLSSVGGAHMELGAYAQALEFYEESVAMYLELMRQRSDVFRKNALGTNIVISWLLLHMGNVGAARARIEAGGKDLATIACETREQVIPTIKLNYLTTWAEVLFGAGEIEEALKKTTEALALTTGVLPAYRVPLEETFARLMCVMARTQAALGRTDETEESAKHGLLALEASHARHPRSLSAPMSEYARDLVRFAGPILELSNFPGVAKALDTDNTL